MYLVRGSTRMQRMDAKTLLEIAEFNVRLCWNKAIKKYPNMFGKPVPKISLNNRFKTTAGMAYYDTNEIKLSTELFAEHTEHFVADTIPHEVAHIVDWIVFGEWGHGPTWKRVMRECYNLEPARLHNMTNSKHEARKAKI